MTDTQWGFLASLALEVPSFIPIIGGLKLGEADAIGVFPRKNFTITCVADGVVTTVGHDRADGQQPLQVQRPTSRAPPAGFDTGEIYYVTPTGPERRSPSRPRRAARPTSTLTATGGSITIGPYFIAGWIKFLGRWTIGAKYDFLSQSWSEVTGDDVSQPDRGTARRRHQPAAVQVHRPVRRPEAHPKPDVTAAADPDTYSSALFHVPLTGNDPQTQIWVTVGRRLQAALGDRPGPGSSVDVGGVRFSLADEISRGRRRRPSWPPRVPGGGRAGPPRPVHARCRRTSTTVSAGQRHPQKDPNPDPKAAGWVGTFRAPPPQGRNLSLARPPRRPRPPPSPPPPGSTPTWCTRQLRLPRRSTPTTRPSTSTTTSTAPATTARHFKSVKASDLGGTPARHALDAGADHLGHERPAELPGQRLRHRPRRRPRPVQGGLQHDARSNAGSTRSASTSPSTAAASARDLVAWLVGRRPGDARQRHVRDRPAS